MAVFNSDWFVAVQTEECDTGDRNVKLQVMCFISPSLVTVLNFVAK